MFSESTRRWIETAAGGDVASLALMPGATSCLLHRVEIVGVAGSRTLMLRRFHDAKWVGEEPEIALREAMSLQQATRAGLPVPQIVAIDAKGEHCGVPATLVTEIAGRVVLNPDDRHGWLRGLAEAAARIHRVDAGGFRWRYRRYNERDRLEIPRWSKLPNVWRKAIEVVQGPAPDYSECFVHRDYHPSNVLWENGHVSGIVDWVNGCRGPAGIDVAWCRHNLANLHDVSVADEFLRYYEAAAGSEFTYNPYWDLMSVVELLPGPPAMYRGWEDLMSPISSTVMRERIDNYVMSVVDRI